MTPFDFPAAAARANMLPSSVKELHVAKRMFEMVEGTSSKFWEVWLEGNEVHTRYGRIGSEGKTTVKDEGAPDKAKKLFEKLVAEKTKKGYAEVGGAPTVAVAVTAAVTTVGTEVADAHAESEPPRRILPAPIVRGFHVESFAAAACKGRGHWLQVDRAPAKRDTVLIQLDAYVEEARTVTDWAAAEGEVLIVLDPNRLGVRLRLPKDLSGIPALSLWVGLLVRDDAATHPFQLVALVDPASDVGDAIPGVAETRARYWLEQVAFAPNEWSIRELSDPHFRSAVPALDQSIAAHPTATAFLLRAQARSRLRDVVAARADLATAEQLGLPRATALREGIRIAIHAEELAEARRAADALREVAADDADSHLLIGKVAALQGEHGAAVEAFSRALAVPEPWNAQVALLERARSRRAAGDAKAALADLDLWQERFETTAEACVERGKCLSALARWGDAAKEFRAAVTRGMKGEVEALLADAERRRALAPRPPPRRVLDDGDDD